MTTEETTEASCILPSPTAPRLVAKLFLATQCMQGDALTLRHWRGGWWSHSGANWREASRDDIMARLYDFTDGAFYSNAKDEVVPWSPTKHRIANLMEALKTCCLTDDKVNPGEWLDGRASGRIVACRNGLLDLKSRELLQHTPWFFNLQALTFDYDAEATCPTWEGFMGDLWGDDDEPPMALEEMMGCAVAGKHDLHRILVLVGPPRGGKSTIVNVFTALVGKENTASPSLMGLADDKTLSSLIGKSLCINGDIRATGGQGPKIAEHLLRISGGDSFTIDRKYKEPWIGTLPVLIVQVSNELPTIRDASGALAKRYLPLILRESWEGREDRSLEGRLLAELPGILNLALEGLDAVEKSGRFTEPKASQEAVLDLAEMASPMKRFVNERLAVMPRGGDRDDYVVESGALLAAYNSWAIENHEGQIDKTRLGQRLRAVVPYCARTQPRGEEGGRVSAYSGVRLLRGESPTLAAVSKLSLRMGHNVHVIGGGEG